MGFVVFFFSLVSYLRIAPLPAATTKSPSLIYDANGKVFDQLGSGPLRESVVLNRLPHAVVLATLVAEDRSFYQHFGFSLRGILRALWNNLRHGGIVEGASTITQQLARNLYLDHQRTWWRKLREAIYTLQLEIQLDKEKLLEMYLSTVYYGQGAYGINRAANIYFGKSVYDITLAESAFLASLPRGPLHYSPYQHWQRIHSRQQYILSLMEKYHMVSPQQVREACLEKLNLKFTPVSHGSPASYVRGPILTQVTRLLGLNEEAVSQGGLRIYTTIDERLQRKAESIVANYIEKYGGLQGALVAVDPRVGATRVLVGGRDPVKAPYHRVFARRQPGSTFKSFLYLLALEKGFTPVTQMDSVPTVFSYEGGSYQPANYQHRYANRPITMREAIAHSDNIYAVNTYFRLGGEESIDFARRLGIVSPIQPTPSLALGSYGVTPWELTEAYTTVAAQGIHRPLQLITRVEDALGRVLYSVRPQQERVVSEQNAYVLTKLLGSVFHPGGTAYAIADQVPDHVAAKTGSTPWDGWLAGFTPGMVATTWVGYDHNEPVTAEHIQLGQHIWADFMRYATHQEEPVAFSPPAGVKRVWIDARTGKQATPYCPHTYMEYFVEGTEPKQMCLLHTHPSVNRGEKPLWETLRDFWRDVFQ
ncbi:transglycosylase domain-containing protein [Pasteuria penetrans]|uniref:transglycosylase domain-containing protein n=1 Tax=Pasteuria penetrans TaxID=86005 RepID=UPI00165ADCD2|nr:transglycosylase domain-containing protein [Pasteuria penetrans]